MDSIPLPSWIKQEYLLSRSDIARIDHSLDGRTIFMTGGTGFVGRTLLDRLRLAHEVQGQRFQVSVLTRNPDAFLRQWPEYAGLPWLAFVAGSLSKLPVVNVAYTDVIHAAADTHLQGNGAAWINQIVSGTQATLEFALQRGTKRFLLTSSGAVYGPQPSNLDKLDEDYSGAPLTGAISSVYGQAKRVAEQLCTVFHAEHGLETVVARCFAFSGKHIPVDGAYAIGNFIRDALKGDDIRVKGNGTAVRSYLAGEDMADWLLTLLNRGTPGQAYNVGSDQGITMADLAQTVSRVLAPQQSVIIEGIGIEDSVRSRYIPDTRKAMALGLRSNFSLEEIISRTADQLRESQQASVFERR
jgi:UDP-glucuronate decarboxylase